MLVEGQAGAGNHHERVLFIRAHRHPVFTAHACVDELDLDVVPDPVYVTVAPTLEGVSRRRSAAFPRQPFVGPPRRMGFDFRRLPEHYINATPVRFPAREAGCKPLVAVSDAAVMLLLEFIIGGSRVSVATEPELLDKALSFLVVLEVLEDLLLLFGDDVDHVFVEPFLVISGARCFFPAAVFALLLGLLGLRLWIDRTAQADPKCQGKEHENHLRPDRHGVTSMNKFDLTKNYRLWPHGSQIGIFPARMTPVMSGSLAGGSGRAPPERASVRRAAADTGVCTFGRGPIYHFPKR